MVFLAFRSGAPLSVLFIFSRHDSKIIKEQNTPFTKGFTKMFTITFIFQVLFLIAWAVSFRVISVTLKTFLGVDAGLSIIILWVAGFIFGLIYAENRSRREEKLLLKSELSLLA